MSAAECPFPGMDPFIESQRWAGFHDSLLTDLCDTLTDRLPDRYVVDIQDRVVLTADDGGAIALYGDATVRETGGGGGGPGAAVATVPDAGTVLLTLPEVETAEEAYVEVRESDTNRLVTVVELLSPTNKRGGGRDAYLRKRNALVLTEVHLVELDLLRVGRRLPTREPHPAGDYFTYVSHAAERPRVRVRGWGLRESLPHVSVPLHTRDGEASVDLGRLVGGRYARGGYRRKIDYAADPAPPLPAEDRVWVAERLAAAGLPR